MRVVIAIDLDDDVFARWFPSTPLGSIAPYRVNVEWGVRNVVGEVMWGTGNVTYHNSNGGFQLVRDDLAADIALRVIEGVKERKQVDGTHRITLDVSAPEDAERKDVVRSVVSTLRDAALGLFDDVKAVE